MNDQELEQRIEVMAAQLDRIEKSVVATKNYLMWTFIVTVVLFVLPLVGLVFAVPALLSSYSAALTF